MKKSRLFLVLALVIHNGHVLADLQVDQDRAILIAAAGDATLTKREKLFTYRCETIAKHIGFDDTPTGKATKHSCDVPEVGIAFFAGSDLGKHPPNKIAQYFKDELAKHQVQSEVFIQDDWQYGSAMGFYINGESWLRDPIRPSQAIKKIEALAAETLLLLHTKGKIKKWPTSGNKLE